MLNKEYLQEWVEGRSRDLRVGVCISFFASLGSLFLIIMGGALLEPVMAKVAVTAYIVLLTLFTFIWNDGAIGDIAASRGDLDKDVLESGVGKSFNGQPFGFYRGFAAFIAFGIGITQILLLFS